MAIYYCELGDLKSELGIPVTTETYDDVLYAMIEEAKELIDVFCNREFDKHSDETRYFDGSGTTLWIDDIISITSVSLDEDNDGIYESSMVATDYILYPLNKPQFTHLKISGDSDYGSFARGVNKGVKIVGNWGYASIPQPISRASKMVVVSLFNNRNVGGKRQESLGDYSYVLEDGTLSPTVKSWLKPFRKTP